MAEENYPQPPAGQLSSQSKVLVPINANTSAPVDFPYPDSGIRLSDYDYFERLFLGEHFSAFNIKISDPEYNKMYAKLRYVAINFAGLLSKICADMLFSEPLTIKMPKGDQDFIDGLWEENHMDVQCYEAALSNSYLGDALFKLRIGPRIDGGESEIIIEDITPKIYFPKINGFNVREAPKSEELAWTFKTADNKTYLRKEIHTPGQIVNEVYAMEGTKIKEKVAIGVLGDTNLKDIEPVKIKESLLFHTPNWKTGDRYFGLSDYKDLDSIFFAINNRMSKVDNILDKHGDPILTVPPGILDDKGQVRAKSLGVIEIGEGETGKPEYIVWDAKLESAFTEIEKLVDFMYLTSEISPDILGIGEGKSDSGRALKFKLMRTIAKVARKKLYFDKSLKEMLFTAQKLAVAYGIKVGGKTLAGEPVRPEIEWQDGLPIDSSEQIDTETKALDAGITTTKAAIMRVYGVDEKSADQMLKDRKAENDLNMPTMGLKDNPFGVAPRNTEPPAPKPK
jgi:hypothetical protein